jgi:hypothetical protein
MSMTTDAQADSAAAPSAEYARRLYDDVLGWYHNADAKAQVVLGLDGAFLAFVTAAVFQKPDDLTTLTAKFLPLTWRLLGLMATTLVASMAAAIYCLWSRVYFRPTSVVHSIRAKSEPRTPNVYPSAVMWFFQFIAVLDPPMLRRTLMHADAGFEIDALASQISILSENVRRKHLAVNIGFVLAVVTLLLFAGAAASYVVAVRSAG